MLPHSNNVSTFEAVSFMSLCPTILDLDLRDNFVTALPNYRDTVHDMMPDLKLLDGEPFYDAPAPEESLSSSEYCSSSASEQQAAADAKREFEELTGSGTQSNRVFDPTKLRFDGSGGRGRGDYRSARGNNN